MKFNSLRKHFPSARGTRWIAWGLLMLLALKVAGFTFAYRAAQAYLDANDPRRMQNRSEMAVYFAPPVLTRGLAATPEAVVAHLQELAYEERPGDAPATFSRNGPTLYINSRWPQDFPNAVLTFRGGRLADISVAQQPVERVELEPLPLQNLVSFVADTDDKPQSVRRVVLTPGSVPQLVADAVTSAEDYRFFEHHGLDWLAMGYRFVTSRGRFGASSISQQLIKGNIAQGLGAGRSYTGRFPPLYQRKLMEIPLTLALESRLSKDEILAAYLSMAPFGAVRGTELRGIVAASQEYFGKQLSELSLAEAAILAGMLNAPSAYVKFARQGNACPPLSDGKPDKACRDLVTRRNTVLGLMQRNHPQSYTPEAVTQAQAAPLRFLWASEQRAERPAEAYSSV